MFEFFMAWLIINALYVAIVSLDYSEKAATAKIRAERDQ